MCVMMIDAIACAAGAANTSEKSQVKRDLLVLADMPKGWTSSKATNYTPTIPDAGQLAQCLGVSTSVVTYNPPTVYSPNFTSKNQQLYVQDSVSIYPSAKEAQTSLVAYAAKAPPCYTKAFNGPDKGLVEKSFGSGGQVGSITVTRTPSTDFAAHTSNYTMFFPVTDGESTLNLEVTSTAFVKGNLEQEVDILAVQTTIPTSLTLKLTRIAEARL